MRISIPNITINYKNLDYEIETMNQGERSKPNHGRSTIRISITRLKLLNDPSRRRFGIAINYKNLDYEIETSLMQ